MTETKQTALVVDNEKLRTQLAIGKSNDILIALADDQRWRAMNRSADVMAQSIVGQHLMGTDYNATKMNCMCVVLVADQFGWNPITLAAEAYVVKNKVSYSAKTLYAMLRKHPDLIGSLSRLVEWEMPDGSFSEKPGNNDKMRMTVWGRIKGDDEDRSITCWYKLAAKGGNSPLWTKDPITQLWYYSSRVWSRTWMPDAAQGLYTSDELQDTDLAPETISNTVLVERLESNEVADVDALTQMMTPTAEDEPDEPDEQPEDVEEGEYTTAAEKEEYAQEQKDMDKHETRQAEEPQSIEDEFEQANPQDGTLFDNPPGMEEQ